MVKDTTSSAVAISNSHELMDDFHHIEDQLQNISSLLFLLCGSDKTDVAERQAFRAVHDQVDLLLTNFECANENLAGYLGFDPVAQRSPAREMQERVEKAMRK